MVVPCWTTSPITGFTSPLPLPFGIALIQAMTMNFTYPNNWVCTQSSGSAAAVADHEDGAAETIP
jgi:hypothetical protein